MCDMVKIHEIQARSIICLTCPSKDACVTTNVNLCEYNSEKLDLVRKVGYVMDTVECAERTVSLVKKLIDEGKANYITQEHILEIIEGFEILNEGNAPVALAKDDDLKHRT